MDIPVELDWSEYLQAMQVGCLRAVQNRKLRRRHAHGASSHDAEQCHITGAVGEAMVAKYLRTFWLGVGAFRGPDVGNMQVRTRTKLTYRMILHAQDHDDDVFVSVYASEGAGLIRGWIRGRDGKRPEWWSDPAGGRPAYFVPNEALHPMSDLVAVVQ